jgi:serine/threonine-protein kinase
MLYQLLTGVLPFRGDSMAELMYKIANEEAPNIRIVRPEIPQRLADVVALALSKRPETRYQDGDQFANDLLQVMGDRSASASPAPASQADVRPSAAAQPTDAMDTTQKMSVSTPAFDQTVPGRAVPNPNASAGTGRSDNTDLSL